MTMYVSQLDIHDSYRLDSRGFSSQFIQLGDYAVLTEESTIIYHRLRIQLPPPPLLYPMATTTKGMFYILFYYWFFFLTNIALNGHTMKRGAYDDYHHYSTQWPYDDERPPL
jgi:hypothetical protein